MLLISIFEIVGFIDAVINLLILSLTAFIAIIGLRGRRENQKLRAELEEARKAEQARLDKLKNDEIKIYFIHYFDSYKAIERAVKVRIQVSDLDLNLYHMRFIRSELTMQYLITWMKTIYENELRFINIAKIIREGIRGLEDIKSSCKDLYVEVANEKTYVYLHCLLTGSVQQIRQALEEAIRRKDPREVPESASRCSLVTRENLEDLYTAKEQQSMPR